jgi:hypothetical protein
MPNPWKQFQNLLPQSTTSLGTVITLHTDNTVSIELLGGGVLRVSSSPAISGSATIGTRVFVRDNRIIDTAPELPQFEIEI